MRFFNIKKVVVKFLVPIILLQFAALGVLGFIGYRFSSNMLRNQAEREFKTVIDGVYTSIEKEFSDRISKIEQLVSNPTFIKFSAASHYKSNADVEIFDFQKGNGLILGEPEVGGLVNFPIGLLANEGNRKILETGLFPSVEYAGSDGIVKLHVYLGGSNDRDFELKDSPKLNRAKQEWFKTAVAGNVFVGKPEKTELYLQRYQPITFEIEEVAIEEELIPVAAPHHIGDVVKGVFFISTTPDFISSALQDIKTDSLLLILDGKGNVITERGNQDIKPQITPELLKRANGISPDIIADFDRFLLMHKNIPPANWSILMIGDKNAIYSSVHRLRNSIFLVMVASIAVMAASIFMIIRKLLAPIIHLKNASDRIAKGELGVVIEKKGEDEIGRLTESFNQMSTSTKQMHDRLARMNFVRRQLLNIISHELRTPLNSVVGFYDLMQEEIGSGTQPKELADLFLELGGSIERCKALVERLTRASSIMAAEIRAKEEITEHTNLSEALCSTCEEMKQNAKERGIDITYPKNIFIDVACPANAVRLMFEEALSNAIKYSPDGEKISVSVNVKDNIAGISVKDNGPGIPKEYVEDVTQPFFEVQDADYHSTGRFAKGAGGLGLGLTIIMSILRQYHGSLTIDTPDDGGTLITMYLPTTAALGFFIAS